MTDQIPNAVFWSAVRTLLSAVGGYLVGRGLISQEMMQELIGAATVLVPTVWGVVSKYRAEAKTQVREHIALQVGMQVVQDGKILAPPEAIGPSTAQSLIKEAKQENTV